MHVELLLSKDNRVRGVYVLANRQTEHNPRSSRHEQLCHKESLISHLLWYP